MSDRLPSEVWMQIFALACLDSGITGRHLSLVCHDFHHCSKPYKLQSIALTRGKHIISFYRHISQLPPHEKRVKFLLVRCPNLFLDVSDDEEDMEFQEDDAMSLDTSIKSSNSNGSDVDREMSPSEISDIVEDAEVDYLNIDSPMEGVQSAIDAEIGAVDDLVLEAFRGIMEDVSSTLSLLYVHWTSNAPLLIESLLVPLPHLEELNLFRGCTSEDAALPENDGPSPLLFPKLKYLSCWPPEENPRLPESIERFIIIRTETSKTATPDQLRQMLFGPEWADSRTLEFVDSIYIGELHEEEGLMAEWNERVAGRPGLVVVQLAAQ
ncbi:hypothetical protein NLJ89_g9496 [Agrocybe chaxingu]|uniref:F-box domain-containing protein n=1 Tax=Agrocybe chaxingu TaxID=84603 RepID=A0A9W8JVQ6_9AGAR|nr:hypothetical protein NLJ89_g9496 [Agrocybe chaxingu]